MNTRFDVLFTLGVSNSYYTTAAVDFDFLVPSDAQQLLRNRKLLGRVRDGLLYVLLESDDSGTPLLSAAGETIRLGLQLLNGNFFNFTDSGFSPSQAVPFYRNATTPAVLDDFQPVTLVGNALSHTLTDSARPVTVDLRDSAGATLSTQTVDSTNNRTDVSFDLRNVDPGAYTIRETFPASVKHDTAYYIDPELLQARVFGIVEILVDSTFYTTPPEFEIQFSAKEETLKYYVVTHKYSTADFNQLTLSDQGFTDEGRPEIKFTRVDSGAFTAADISPSLFGNGDIKVVLFKSNAVVARRELGRKKIQLNRNGTLLVQHLPQPGPASSTADMIIHVSKP
jgi:hypothetical protein